MYDIIHKNEPEYLSELSQMNCESNLTNLTLEEVTKYIEILHVTTTECYKGSIYYSGGQMWNSLPKNLNSDES